MERRKYTAAEIAAALTKAGVPEDVQSIFVTFQLEHGGEEDAFGLNKVVWGILHEHPEFLDADKVYAEEDDEHDGVWHVWCADVHPSDTMTLDQHGTLYWSFRKRFTRYQDYFVGKQPDHAL
jgi:hypothetical protein